MFIAKLRVGVKTVTRSRRPLVVSEIFEVPIQEISSADALLVASLNSRWTSSEVIQYRLVEGQLFRSFVLARAIGCWRPAEMPAVAPTVRLDLEEVAGIPTPLRSANFMHFVPPSKDYDRLRARRVDPVAFDRAEQDLYGLACRSLRMIDGVMFHASRSPAYSVFHCSDTINANATDVPWNDEIYYIDPRYSRKELSTALNAMKLEGPEIKVIDEDALPETWESDSVGAFSRSLARLGHLHDQEMLVRMAQKLLLAAQRDSLEDAFQQTSTELQSWKPAPVGAGLQAMVLRDMKLALTIRRLLPVLRSTAGEEIDASSL